MVECCKRIENNISCFECKLKDRVNFDVSFVELGLYILWLIMVLLQEWQQKYEGC